MNSVGTHWSQHIPDVNYTDERTSKCYSSNVNADGYLKCALPELVLNLYHLLCLLPEFDSPSINQIQIISKKIKDSGFEFVSLFIIC